MRLLAQLTEYLGIEVNQTSHLERLISGLATCAAIALVAYLTQWTLGDQAHLLFFASSAASAFLVFALPHGALSQPWPVLIGQSLAMLMGIGCFIVLGDGIVAAALAVGLTVFGMHYLRCLHPPGAATAFFFVTGVTPDAIAYTGFAFVFNIAVIIVLGMIMNNLFHWRRYPSQPKRHKTKPTQADRIELEDWHQALTQHDAFLDVSLEELQTLYEQAHQVAQRRQS
ncbi:HPP family protein [Marinomonas ostreistagni]|uniref:HPP family protein n=1 Tax=Marinomonas ostreistagni TaxID=359209 RepID=UPI00194E3830|nr:HPP family protein [Marinomonas ostreistagni]MBM6550850.1 HPP family protein [Marinomonas ostreistagni]